jgi:hypothetical protein
MSERRSSPYDDVARRWHALAERRRLYIVALRDSDRWHHYYTREGLLDALREAANARDIWARIAGLVEGDPPSAAGAEAASEASADWPGVELFRKAG